MNDSVRSGRGGLGAEFAVGVEVLPRNFFGGLSRSPAAGSTTQRSSTSLGDKAAGSAGENTPTSPQPPPLRAGGSRAPGRPPKKTASLTTPHHPAIPFPGERQDLLEWRWGSPQEKHKDTPNPHPTPELEMSVGSAASPGCHTLGCNSCHSPDHLLHRPGRAVGDGGGRGKGTERD